MKPFRFSLQPVRVLREQREQQMQRRFGEAMRRREDAVIALQQAGDELAAEWNALCEELSSGVAMSTLLKSRAWCNVLEQRQKQRRVELIEAQHAMDAAWRDMMLATRDREALDKFHDKCRRAHDREVQRGEQKVLDELGVRRVATVGALLGSSAETELN
jgi:flagellar export protein FliJ